MTTPRKRAAPAKKRPPRKTVPPATSAVAPSAKKAAAKKAPAAKKTQAKKIPAGGKVARAEHSAKAGGKGIPKDASLLAVDPLFAERVLDELKLSFPPETIVKHFQDLLGNPTVTTKHGEARPDPRAKLAALEKLVHLTVGKPIDRRENVTSTTWSHEEIEELIAHSRELRQALRAMLAPYDEEDRKTQS